jgi:hypothetical protein
MYIEVYSSLSQVMFEAYVEFKIHTTYQTARCHGPEEHNLNHSLPIEEITLFVSIDYKFINFAYRLVIRNQKFYCYTTWSFTKFGIQVILHLIQQYENPMNFLLSLFSPWRFHG